MENEEKSKNLTAVHLRQLKIATQEVRREVAAAGISLEYLPKDIREKLFGDGLRWSLVYELSVIQHSALFYYSLGLIEPIRAALAESEDKLQAFLDFEKNFDPDEQEAEEFLNSDANAERRGLFAFTFIALLRQHECLEREGCYLSDLVEKVRQGGADAFVAPRTIAGFVEGCMPILGR